MAAKNRCADRMRPRFTGCLNELKYREKIIVQD